MRQQDACTEADESKGSSYRIQRQGPPNQQANFMKMMHQNNNLSQQQFLQQPTAEEELMKDFADPSLIYNEPVSNDKN